MDDETTEHLISSEEVDTISDDSSEIEFTDVPVPRPLTPILSFNSSMNWSRRVNFTWDSTDSSSISSSIPFRNPDVNEDTQFSVFSASTISLPSNTPEATVTQDYDPGVNEDSQFSVFSASTRSLLSNTPEATVTQDYDPGVNEDSQFSFFSASTRSPPSNTPEATVTQDYDPGVNEDSQFSISSVSTRARSPPTNTPEATVTQDERLSIFIPLGPDSPSFSTPSSSTIAENPPAEVLANQPQIIVMQDSDEDLDEDSDPPEVSLRSLPAPIQPSNPIVQNSTSHNMSLKPELNERKVPDPILNSSVASESEDGSLCSICMDPFTNSGNHQVCCLRCGHIFGRSCVERWIKMGCNNGARRCPTCNKKASLKDIRILFLHKVVPLDTVERDRLIEEKEKVVAARRLTEMELARCKVQSELTLRKYENKVLKLENQLRDAVSTIEQLSRGEKIDKIKDFNQSKDKVMAELLHRVDISKEGGCRVLAYNCLQQELVVSQPTGNTLFAGFGVRILNTVDFKPSTFILLHHKMIRDLSFHGEDRNLLLSVSLDNAAKLTDVGGCANVHTFKADSPLWSCCWDATNPHLLLLGSQSGKVYQYDRRMVDACVRTWEEECNTSPVVALASTPSVARTPFPQGGIVACRLTGVHTYARHGDKYCTLELPIDGPFMSMKYNCSSQTLLTATRPSSRCPNVRINLNLMDVDTQGQTCVPTIHTFTCGSSARYMSRLTTLPVSGDSLVVAHHESGRTVNMWSSKTGGPVHSFQVKEPTIDLASMEMSDKCLLATLSSKTVAIYKMQP